MKAYGFSSREDFDRVVKAAMQADQLRLAAAADALDPATRETRVFVTVTGPKIASDRRDLYPALFWVRNGDNLNSGPADKDWYSVGDGQMLPQKGNACVALTPNGEALKKNTRYEGRVVSMSTANPTGSGNEQVAFVVVDVSDANDIVRVTSATADGATGWYDAYIQEPAAEGNPGPTDGVRIWAKNFGSGGVRAGKYMASFVTRQPGATGRAVYGIIADDTTSYSRACHEAFAGVRPTDCLFARFAAGTGLCADFAAQEVWLTGDSVTKVWTSDTPVDTPLGPLDLAVWYDDALEKWRAKLYGVTGSGSGGESVEIYSKPTGCDGEDMAFAFGGEVLCPGFPAEDCDDNVVLMRVGCRPCPSVTNGCWGPELPKCLRVTYGLRELPDPPPANCPAWMSEIDGLVVDMTYDEEANVYLGNTQYTSPNGCVYDFHHRMVCITGAGLYHGYYGSGVSHSEPEYLCSQTYGGTIDSFGSPSGGDWRQWLYGGGYPVPGPFLDGVTLITSPGPPTEYEADCYNCFGYKFNLSRTRLASCDIADRPPQPPVRVAGFDPSACDGQKMPHQWRWTRSGGTGFFARLNGTQRLTVGVNQTGNGTEPKTGWGYHNPDWQENGNTYGFAYTGGLAGYGTDPGKMFAQLRLQDITSLSYGVCQVIVRGSLPDNCCGPITMLASEGDNPYQDADNKVPDTHTFEPVDGCDDHALGDDPCSGSPGSDPGSGGGGGGGGGGLPDCPDVTGPRPPLLVEVSGLGPGGLAYYDSGALGAGVGGWVTQSYFNDPANPTGGSQQAVISYDSTNGWRITVGTTVTSAVVGDCGPPFYLIFPAGAIYTAGANGPITVTVTP